MQLPKLTYPTITITIPNTTTKYMFRPMLVKEEKLLLMAKSSEDETDILSTIKQVVNNTSIDPSFDVNSLPLFILEYIFIKLRGFSIGDEIDVSYKDFEDEKIYNFKIDLTKIDIRYPETENKILVSKTSGIIMKYPSATIYDDKEFLKSIGDESFYKLIVKCIDQVFDETNVYDAKEFPEAELLEFIELMDIKSFEKIRDYMMNLPTVFHKLEYTNSLGNNRSIELSSLTDFFTLH